METNTAAHTFLALEPLPSAPQKAPHLYLLVIRVIQCNAIRQRINAADQNLPVAKWKSESE